MIKHPFLLVLSLLFIASTHDAFSFYVTPEASCASIDLRADFSLKMRDQGNISWCYAHAAADYLQFYNRIPVQISAADIALNYNKRLWPRFLRWLSGGVVPETGFIRSAIYDISLVGYCPEEYFPSETWVKRFMNGKNEGEKINVPLGAAVAEIVALMNQVKEGFYLTPSDLPYVYEFKDVNHQQFFDALFQNPTGDVLSELRSAACDAHRQQFPKFITDISMSLKSKSTFNQINFILDQHSALTVDFFYGFLENRDQYKRTFSELHTTLLMGRRFNSETEECQYLIKNSYGTDCSSYDHHHQCDAGYIWVSESSLYGAMTSYVSILESEKINEIAPQTQGVQDNQLDSSVH